MRDWASLSLNEIEDEHFPATARSLSLIVFSHWTWQAACCLYGQFIHLQYHVFYWYAKKDKLIIVIWQQHMACVPIPPTRISHDWFFLSQWGKHTQGSSAMPHLPTLITNAFLSILTALCFHSSRQFFFTTPQIFLKERTLQMCWLSIRTLP